MKALKNRIKKLEQVNKEKQCIFISNYNDLIKLQHNEIILYFKNEKELKEKIKNISIFYDEVVVFDERNMLD